MESSVKHKLLKFSILPQLFIILEGEIVFLDDNAGELLSVNMLNNSLLCIFRNYIAFSSFIKHAGIK